MRSYKTLLSRNRKTETQGRREEREGPKIKEKERGEGGGRSPKAPGQQLLTKVNSALCWNKVFPTL